MYLYSTTIDDFLKFVSAGCTSVYKTTCFPRNHDFHVSSLPGARPSGPIDGFRWTFMFPVGAYYVDGGHAFLAASPQHNGAGRLQIQQIGDMLAWMGWNAAMTGHGEPINTRNS